MKKELKEKLRKIVNVEEYVETKRREADEYYNSKVKIADELVKVAEEKLEVLKEKNQLLYDNNQELLEMITDGKMYFDIKSEVERLREEATSLKKSSDNYFPIQDLFIVQYCPFSNTESKKYNYVNIDVFKGQLQETCFILTAVFNSSLYGALDTNGANIASIDGINKQTNINVQRYISLNEIFMLQGKKSYDNLASIDDINEAIIFAIEHASDLNFIDMGGRNRLLSKNKV